MWVQSVVTRGLQQTSLKVTFAETHGTSKHFPDLQSMRRAQEGTSHMFNSQWFPHWPAHVDSAQLFFFFCFSEVCFGVGPTFSSIIAPAVLACSCRTSSRECGVALVESIHSSNQWSSDQNSWAGYTVPRPDEALVIYLFTFLKFGDRRKFFFLP